MNAIDLLKEDHRVVDALFKMAEDAPPSRQATIFKDIKNELDTHAHIEEKIFYPALKKKGDKDAKDIVLEGLEEHHYMKMSLGELARLRSSSERFSPKLKVMIEMTRHHVKEEEGMGGMFSSAKEHLSDDELEKLGKRMEAEKAKYMKEHRIKPVDRSIAMGPIDSIVAKAKELVGQVMPSDKPAKTKAKSVKTKAAPEAKAKKAAPMKRSAAAGS